MARPLLVMPLLLVALCACDRPPTAPSKPAPAQVENPVGESGLAVVKLTAKAEERLGIEAVRVRLRPARRFRVYGASLVLPPGGRLLLAAPVAGRIGARSITEAGLATSAGQELFFITPLLPPEHLVPRPLERAQLAETRAVALAALKELEEQVAAAQIDFDRAADLLARKVGSVRARDQAKAQLAILKASRIKAEARAAALADEAAAAAPAEQVIVAPQAGVVVRLDAKPGQIVAAGAPLGELVSYDRMWARAPVFVGEAEGLEREAEAELSLREGGAARQSLRPIAGLPTADPLAATVDLYFAVDNADGGLRPGQRVWLRVAVKGEDRLPAVPYAAVIYDRHGGAWVYERLAAGAYARRRIVLRHAAGDWAFIDGVKEGAEVVSVGAAELFGVEFWTR